MKKIIITLMAILALTGCGESTPQNKEDITTKTYSNTEIEIKIPIDWEIIESNKFTSNISKNTIVAFISGEKGENFTSNINITKIKNTKISLEDFAKASILNAKKRLIDFKDNGSEKTTRHNTDFISNSFSGKQKVDEPIINFTQNFAKKNENIYTLTYAYPPNENIANNDSIKKSLESFIIK